jgi:predicted enzyme related to lactoylglutathione lyase
VGDPVVRWQIVSPRPDDVSRFYSGVFGWRVSRHNALGARDVSTESAKGIPGALWPAPPDAPTFVQFYAEVADVDATLVRAVAEGATVIVPRSVLPDGDVMAILRDPFGMSFGVVQAAAPAAGPSI